MPAHPPARALWATYAGGFFSLSLLQMVALATPLLGGQIGLSAAMIGIVVGCRSFTPLVYSIHFGAMMDAIGVRRVMLGFALATILLPPLYPLLPFAPALIVLQLVLGLASAMVWLASQTAVARLAAGNAIVTGRFSFITVIGTVAGPLMLGLAWDRGGAWAGYGLISLWGTALLAVSLALPARRERLEGSISWRHLVPQWSAYRAAWIILRRPVAAFIIACTFLRLASVSMQESFYPVLLQQNGLTPTAIGTLFAIGNLASSPASLAAGRFARWFGSDRRALLWSVAISVIAITATPLLNGFWLLAVAISIYGLGLGVSMPLILSMLSRGVGPDEQGTAAGLRATANRLAAFVLPVAMGLTAATVGIAASFWVMGAILLVAALAVAVLSRGRL